MEIHLDLIGGLAGDMFIAALLDAFPQYESTVLHAIDAMSRDCPLYCSLVPHRDRVLLGRRFQVRQLNANHQPADHQHVTWESIRTQLRESTLSPAIKRHALGIFELLADAEAVVHGILADQVTFHEVGAWDSIADVVGAAALIDAVGARRWTASPAPLGFGQVRTAHGMLPLPAPATARLLLGMATMDDGVGGERVTPTGAAILRYLCPPAPPAHRPAPVRTLIASGTGFGTRTLPGRSNHVRVLCFETSAAGSTARSIDVLEFEVDDQSGEDLATGLDRLRLHPGVADVTQTAVFGKKGRMMVHVRVLARGAQLNDVIESCFRETTTIGLRHHAVEGIGLERESRSVDVDGHRLRVKVVERPGGRTAKAESDDVLSHAAHAKRAALRARAEEAVLRGEGMAGYGEVVDRDGNRVTISGEVVERCGERVAGNGERTEFHGEGVTSDGDVTELDSDLVCADA